LRGTYSCAAVVPLVSSLGPVLFIIYISDPPRHPKTRLFDDDTVLFCSSINVRQATRYVQEHLDKLQKYYDLWKIKINASKTESILFTKRRKMISDSPLTLHHNGIDIKTQEGVFSRES
jgi:hypothetical protein